MEYSKKGVTGINQNTKTGLIIGGVALGLLIAVPQIWGGISGWQGEDWGMMGPGMMGGFGWGWFRPVFMILFWGLVIWAVVALVRGAANLTWGIRLWSIPITSTT